MTLAEVHRYFARRLVRFVAIFSAMVMAPHVALAQDAPAPGAAADAAQLDTIEVTGSRLKRVDLEGPLPVVVIDREAIDSSGDISIADFLKDQTFNSFGSFTPASGFAGGAQGGQLISLRGLGSTRTLILIDGRRMPASPAFSGVSQNLSAVPLAAVERIEILREGASAVYGSDAIGGVINIITRKDFRGAQISGQVERPSQEGGDGASSSLVTGYSSAEGNLFLALDHNQRDIIFSRDRAYTSGRTSPLGGPGSFRRRAVMPGGASGGAPGPYEPMAGCGTTPESSIGNVPEIGSGTGCRYDFTLVSAETAATTRDTLTVNGSRKITDSMTGFGRFIATRADAFGRFAPAPAFFGNFVSPTNPKNPTIGEAACDQNTDGDNNPATNPTGCWLDLAFRFTSLGNRDSFTEDDVRQTLVGVNGISDWLGGSEWEVSVNDNRYGQNDLGYNYGLIPVFRSEVESTAAGSFNPFAPTAAAAARVRHTIARDNLTISRGVDSSYRLTGIPGVPFRMPVALGAEYRDDAFQTQSDAQSDAGNVFGSAGGSARGDRTYSAFFVEMGIFPIDMLEFTVAARMDRYSDFGSQVSPKVSFGVRPIEQVLFRGSYSEGFRAPDLDILNRPGTQSFPFTVDTLRCQAAGGTGPLCTQAQRETSFRGNPDLGPEESENMNFGVVVNLIDDLSIGLDYYSVELTEGIGNLSAQNVLDNEFRCSQQGRTCSPSREGTVVRDATNTVSLIIAPAANFAKLETSGVDFEVDYTLNVADYGRFKLKTAVSYILEFKTQTTPDGSLIEQADTVAIPEYRAIGSLDWKLGSLGALLGMNYIAATMDCTPVQRDAKSAACNQRFDSFITVDMQANYDTPWNSALTVGVRNVFDQDPSISRVLGTRYDRSLHDMIGRVPYVRFTQNF